MRPNMINGLIQNELNDVLKSFPLLPQSRTNSCTVLSARRLWKAPRLDKVCIRAGRQAQSHLSKYSTNIANQRLE